MSSSMSSSIESSHNGPYFPESDDSTSNIRNPAFIPNESDRIVMVSAPTSSDDEDEVSHAPPVAGESMELDGETVAVEANNDGVTVAVEANNDGITVAVEANNDGVTVAVEANNDGVIDLESDTDTGAVEANNNGVIDLESDTETVAVEANNNGVIDLESDTDIEAPKRSDFDDGDTLSVAVVNMELDGETVAVEANNNGVVDLESDTDLRVRKKSDFDDGNSSTDTEELLLSLKNCCPESDSESELQILDSNFEAGGSSKRKRGFDISTQTTEEENMQTENISIPEAREDQQPTLPPLRFISSMEKNKGPMTENNSTSPINATGSVGEDDKTDVEKPSAIESELVDLKGKKKQFNILDLLRKLVREEEDMKEDKSYDCRSLLEVAEERWGKF